MITVLVVGIDSLSDFFDEPADAFYRQTSAVLVSLDEFRVEVCCLSQFLIFPAVAFRATTSCRFCLAAQIDASAGPDHVARQMAGHNIRYKVQYGMRHVNRLGYRAPIGVFPEKVFQKVLPDLGIVRRLSRP